MKDPNSEQRRRANKVSHSLDSGLSARLKELAYSERVSESAIIEYVLSEFFVLGDNATLGRIIRDSALRLRRNQPHFDRPLSMERLLDDVQEARLRLIQAFEAWHKQPGPESLKVVGLARAEIAAVLNRISRAQNESDDAKDDPVSGLGGS